MLCQVRKPPSPVGLNSCEPHPATARPQSHREKEMLSLEHTLTNLDLGFSWRVTTTLWALRCLTHFSPDQLRLWAVSVSWTASFTYCRQSSSFNLELKETTFLCQNKLIYLLLINLFNISSKSSFNLQNVTNFWKMNIALSPKFEKLKADLTREWQKFGRSFFFFVSI